MKFLLSTGLTVVALGLSLTGCTSPAVEEQLWVLESFDSESAPVEPGVTSQFSLSDGTVTGNGGVNNFTGTYEMSGNDISFSQLASTRMAGPPEAMEQEARFLKALEGASRINVRHDTMTLSDAEDAVVMLLSRSAED